MYLKKNNKKRYTKRYYLYQNKRLYPTKRNIIYRLTVFELKLVLLLLLLSERQIAFSRERKRKLRDSF